MAFSPSFFLSFSLLVLLACQVTGSVCMQIQGGRTPIGISSPVLLFSLTHLKDCTRVLNICVFAYFHTFILAYLYTCILVLAMYLHTTYYILAHFHVSILACKHAVFQACFLPKNPSAVDSDLFLILNLLVILEVCNFLTSSLRDSRPASPSASSILKNFN